MKNEDKSIILVKRLIRIVNNNSANEECRWK